MTPTNEMIVAEVRELFDSRCSEVERYISFLSIIEENKATAVARYDSSTETTVIVNDAINRELIKTMRANGYLLLYNLVESTMTNAIDAIHQSLKSDENCCFDDLSTDFKRIILENFKKTTSNANSILDGDHPIHRSILDFGYDKKELFKGNIDARLIRTTAERYGFQIAEHDKSISRDGARLLNVKQKRNQLAHGSISFEECGHEISTDELIQISTETKIYLDATLKGVEEYIINRTYRYSHSA